MHALYLIALCAAAAAGPVPLTNAPRQLWGGADSAPAPVHEDARIWCTIDKSCRAHGDDGATCNTLTHQCDCSSGYGHWVSGTGGDARSIKLCVADAASAADKNGHAEKRHRVAVYSEYPKAYCIEDIGQRVLSAEKAVLKKKYGDNEHMGNALACGGIRSVHTVNMKLSDFAGEAPAAIHDLFLDELRKNRTLYGNVSTLSPISWSSTWLMDNERPCESNFAPKKKTTVAWDFGNNCRAMECLNDGDDHKYKLNQDWLVFRCDAEDDEITTAAIIGFSLVGFAIFIAGLGAFKLYREVKTVDAELELMALEEERALEEAEREMLERASAPPSIPPAPLEPSPAPVADAA